MSKSSIYWKCGNCKNKYRSDTLVRHEMDTCLCGASAVDAEEYYSRWIGDAIQITKKEYESR